MSEPPTPSSRARAVRLPVPELPDAAGAVVSLSSAAHHYLVEVRRLGEGAPVRVFDGRGREAQARLAATPDGLALVLESAPVAGLAGADVTLVYAFPKGDKLFDVLRQATELGVGRVVLFVAERSVSRPEGERADGKRERWARIVSEAARQCGRADTPLVEGPMSLAAALDATADDAARWVLEPTAERRLVDLSPLAPLSVWVGPEGGFSKGELSRLEAAGAESVRLGETVLRTETAAPVAVALALHRLGWM